MKFKSFIASLVCILLCMGSCTLDSSAQSIEQNHRTLARSLVVGKGDGAKPDASAHVTLGDTMSSKAALLISETDTGNVASSARKFGNFLLQRSDSSLYLWVGDRWRKLAYIAEE